jgi:hypothetical protein
VVAFWAQVNVPMDRAKARLVVRRRVFIGKKSRSL